MQQLPGGRKTNRRPAQMQKMRADRSSYGSSVGIPDSRGVKIANGPQPHSTAAARERP
jgi:hypothetical protein